MQFIFMGGHTRSFSVTGVSLYSWWRAVHLCTPKQHAVLSDAIWGQRLFLAYMCGLWHHQTDLRVASTVLKFVLNTKIKRFEGVISWKEENTVSDHVMCYCGCRVERWTVVYIVCVKITNRHCFHCNKMYSLFVSVLFVTSSNWPHTTSVQMSLGILFDRWTVLATLHQAALKFSIL